MTAGAPVQVSNRPADLGRLVEPPPVVTLWAPPPIRPPVVPEAWKGLVMPDLATLQRVIDGLRTL
jgi:hypothetical protein